MKEDNLFIRKDSILRKYTLSFNTDLLSFELCFPRKTLDFFRSLERLPEMIKNTEDEFLFDEKWNIHSEKYFGYGQCMKINFKKDMVVLVAQVNRKKGRALSCTFSEILPIFTIMNDNFASSYSEEQEMYLETYLSAKPQMYGAAMSADLSSNFSLWLYEQNDILRNEVNINVHKAMNKLFRILWDLEPTERNRFGLHGHGFLLEPPAGVYTSQFGILPEEESRFGRFPQGYNTFCHNLDSWHQQLVLLAGFLQITKAYRDSLG